MHEQLEALWNSRDKDQPFVSGRLLTRSSPNNPVCSLQGESNLLLTEKWFTLIGHALFFCKCKDSSDYSGVYLTDLFAPAVARVNQKVLDEFDVPEELQPCTLYLQGVLMDVEIVVCPASMEEKRIWLEKLQQAGLHVPTRKPSILHGRNKDGREKVVVINGSINDSLYTSPEHELTSVRNVNYKWAQQWRRAALKALSLPDASQIRIKFEFLQRFLQSEVRYLEDLNSLVDVYYLQLKIAVDSNLVAIKRDQLDAIFMNCESLLMLHKVFCAQFEKVLSLPSGRVGELLLAFIPHLDLYSEFIRNHDRATKVLDSCLQTSSLADFLENHHSSHDCEAHQLRLLLHQPVSRLEIYEAFVEKVIEQTSEGHVDYNTLGQALEGIQDMKDTLAKGSSRGEHRERILNIIEGVGARGFILLNPQCKLILEDEMYLPATSKWVTGTIRRRPVHCYLYTNALVVISTDKKTKQASSRSQVFPLSGASVYEHVSRSGEVTHAKDPEVEIRALKIYSPNGPRNGAVIIFLTQSSKSLWLAKISEMIALCNPDAFFPPSPPPGPHPSSPHPRTSTMIVTTPPQSPVITPRHSKGRRASSNSILTNSTSHLLSDPPSGKNHSEEGSKGFRKSPILMSRSKSSITFQDEKSSIENRSKSQCLPISSLFTYLISSPPSPHYPDIFLLTYRIFTNAHEVLDALLEAHRKELNARSKTKQNGFISMESLRFFNILRLWVQQYYVDFHHDVTLKQVLVLYLDNIKKHGFVQDKEVELADDLLKSVSKRDHIPLIRRSKLKIQIPKAVHPVPEHLSAIPTAALAEQLTLMEHELYSRIKPYEFLQQKWTKKKRLELAPNICHVITRFNQMTEWVSKVVLSPDQPRQRCNRISTMIRVAERALELNNFVSVFQITAALCSTAIQRLKKTWDLIPQSLIEQFENMRKLTSVEGSSKVYRDKQSQSSSPSVPYIGPYLNQLVSIEVGMATFVKNPPEHINFTKLSRLAKVIEEVVQFQSPPYSLSPAGSIMIFIEQELEESTFDEDQRYSRSIELEPRKQGSKRVLAKLMSTD